MGWGRLAGPLQRRIRRFAILNRGVLLFQRGCRYALVNRSKMLIVMKKLILPALAVLTLAACEDPFDREGVGFTGIDGEPRTISGSKGAAAFVPDATNVPAELAELPTIQIVSDKVEADKLAGVAIDNAGRTPGNAVQLTGSSTSMYLSTVDVNGTLYGVLRTENNSTRVDNSIGEIFGSETERFTGCLPAGDVFGKGSSSRSSGFAVPLNCS